MPTSLPAGIAAAGIAVAIGYIVFRHLQRPAETVSTSSEVLAAAPEKVAAVAATSTNSAESPAPSGPPPPLARAGLHILHSGGFAAEVAAELATALVKSDASLKASIHEHPMVNFKTWAKETMLTDGDKAWPPLKVVFIAATIENEQPPEDAGACVRYFNRKTHATDMLLGRLHFAVLGLGDSNLLLDRQTTTAKDCNQVARRLDTRLAALGAERMHTLGQTDDRTGNTELAPWLESLVATWHAW